MRASSVLVVEDDPTQSYFCRAVLEAEGYRVSCALSGHEAIEQIALSTFDVVLLDLNLPDRDGLMLAADLMEEYQLPLIMMTVRDKPDQRVAGFEAGAVDYIVKPFHPGELCHRVRRVLEAAGPAASGGACLSIGSCRLYPDECLLKLGNRMPMPLTMGETRVLEVLMRARGRPISRETLMEAVSRKQSGNAKTVDVLVSRLRRKLAKVSSDLQLKTVYGLGYQLVAESRG